MYFTAVAIQNRTLSDVMQEYYILKPMINASYHMCGHSNAWILTSQVLVFTAHSLQLLLALLIGTLEPEELSGIVAALLLASIKLGSQVINFKLPFANDLIKCFLLLLSSICNGSCTINLQLQILYLSSQPLLSLFQGYNLLV